MIYSILAECGGTYFGRSGIVHSPNYPNNYGNNEDCVWFFSGPTGHYLTFSFDTFNTEEAGNNCTEGDWLELRERNSTGKCV